MFNRVNSNVAIVRGRVPLTIVAERGQLSVNGGEWGIRATEPEQSLMIYGANRMVSLTPSAVENRTRTYEAPYSKGVFRVEVYFGDGYQSISVSQVSAKGIAFRFTCVGYDLLDGYLQILDDEALFADLKDNVLRE